MRNRLMTVTAALLLASATFAAAQTRAAAPGGARPPGPTAPSMGSIDFGGVFGDVNGDEARYERYRDARNGVYTDFSFAKETGAYFFDAKANHIGYRDQRYSVDLRQPQGEVRVPVRLASRSTTTTMRSRRSRVAAAPRAARRVAASAVQNRQAKRHPVRVRVDACGNLTAANAALASRSIYNNTAERASTCSRSADTSASTWPLRRTRTSSVTSRS